MRENEDADYIHRLASETQAAHSPSRLATPRSLVFIGVKKSEAANPNNMADDFPGKEMTNLPLDDDSKLYKPDISRYGLPSFWSLARSDPETQTFLNQSGSINSTAYVPEASSQCKRSLRKWRLVIGPGPVLLEGCSSDRST